MATEDIFREDYEGLPHGTIPAIPIPQINIPEHVTPEQLNRLATAYSYLPGSALIPTALRNIAEQRLQGQKSQEYDTYLDNLLKRTQENISKIDRWKQESGSTAPAPLPLRPPVMRPEGTPSVFKISTTPEGIPLIEGYGATASKQALSVPAVSTSTNLGRFLSGVNWEKVGQLLSSGDANFAKMALNYITSIANYFSQLDANEYKLRALEASQQTAQERLGQREQLTPANIVSLYTTLMKERNDLMQQLQTMPESGEKERMRAVVGTYNKWLDQIGNTYLKGIFGGQP